MTEPQPVRSGSEWSLIQSTLGPYKRRGIGVLALVILDTVFASLGVGMVFPVFQALLAPSHNSPLLNQIMPALEGMGPDSRLVFVAVFTVAIFGFKAGVTMLTTVSSNAFLQELRFYWVGRIGEYYLLGSHRRVSGKKPGELLNDWFNETLAATRFFQSSIAFLSSALLVIALVLIGTLVDWRVMLGMVVVGGLIALLARRSLFGGSARLSKIKVALNQSVSSNMIENLTHVRDLKLLQAEALRLASLRQHCDSLAKAVLKGAVLAEVPRVAGEFLAVLALMVFVVVSVKALNQPPAEILPLMAFFFIAFYRLVSAASTAAAARVKALNELHSLDVINQLLSRSIEREDVQEGTPLVALRGDIQLRDIHFAYDINQPVLSGVTATIPYGKTTLLVGPSGSGKSTLLDLLMRLEVPWHGAIEVMGQTASAYRLADWRRQFGYVSQEATLFNGDIAMNLRLANPDASDTEMAQACHLAGAEAFIAALPNGYATVVGDRGFSLSGGQRKRIAIARALIRKPSVLILDEATTSFEQSLEQSMLSALRKAMPDLTIIQVTHRLAHQEGVDWVVALQGGKIVTEGAWENTQSCLAPMYETS